MTIMKLFAIAVGIAGIAEKIDEISDTLGIEISDRDIQDAIKNVNEAKEIGTSVWLMFMEKLEDELQRKYPNFEPDKFDWFLSGRYTRLFYDEQEFYSINELEDFLGKLFSQKL